MPRPGAMPGPMPGAMPWPWPGGEYGQNTTKTFPCRRKYAFQHPEAPIFIPDWHANCSIDSTQKITKEGGFMSRKIFVMLLLALFAGRVYAQDVIHTIDTKPIQAKVIEIGDDYIWYKTYDNPDGPDYKMSVSRVTKIVFENGTVKSFAPESLFGYRSPYVYDGTTTTAGAVSTARIWQIT